MRSSVLLVGVSFVAMALTPSLAAADGYESRYAGPPPFSWTGMYLGIQMGEAWGHAHVSDPYGPSIFGDNVSTPGPFAGGLIGFNWQTGTAVVGVEADANFANLVGTNTCFAFSGSFVSSN